MGVDRSSMLLVQACICWSDHRNVAHVAPEAAPSSSVQRTGRDMNGYMRDSALQVCIRAEKWVAIMQNWGRGAGKRENVLPTIHGRPSRQTDPLRASRASLLRSFVSSSLPLHFPRPASLSCSTLLLESASLVLFSSNIGEGYELTSHPDALLV